MVASMTARLEGGLSSTSIEDCSDNTQMSQSGPNGARRLKTTIKDPQSIERDKLNYLYGYYGSEQHIPGICPCEACVAKQEELMAWALQTAQEQHAQAVAAAVAASEEAQKSGTGPKPMMVTPYKHNWVIAGPTDEMEEGLNAKEYVHVSHVSLHVLGLLIGRAFSETFNNYGRNVTEKMKLLVARFRILDRTV